MKKYYHLKSIQKIRGADYFCVTASIFLDERRIGSLRTCPDTEEIKFEFALYTDWLAFKTFTADWWAKEDRSMHYDLGVQAIKKQIPGYRPALSTKMRCWVKSIVANENSKSSAIAAA